MDSRDDIPRRRPRWPAVALSAAAHAALLGALLLAVVPPAAPMRADPDVVPFRLVPPPEPPPEPEPEPETPAPAEAPAQASPPRPSTSPIRPPAVPPPADVVPLVAPVAEVPRPAPSLGDAELVGARTAGSGGGGAGAGTGSGEGEGEGCDMVRRIETALRRDARVRAAVAQAQGAVGPGRALLVWNGDWVTSGGEAGKGLAGLRQAIAWEVGFAPEACRREPMRGLVLISLGEGRVALGAGAWRWTDLLGRRRG